MSDQPDQGDPSSTPADPTSPLDFDPYRFGKPDRPIPPEYAPPGYVQPGPPPPAQQPPAGQAPVWPPRDEEQQATPYGGANYGAPQQGYTPHPPPPPGYPAYGVVGQSNGKATAALVLGICSLFAFWLTVLDLALAIPAIVFGALAIRDSKRYPGRGGRGKGMAGLICGIVAVVLVAVTLVVVYVRIKPCLQYGISSSNYHSCVNDRL